MELSDWILFYASATQNTVAYIPLLNRPCYWNIRLACALTLLLWSIDDGCLGLYGLVVLYLRSNLTLPPNSTMVPVQKFRSANQSLCHWLLYKMCLEQKQSYTWDMYCGIPIVLYPKQGLNVLTLKMGTERILFLSPSSISDMDAPVDLAARWS